MRSDCSVNDSLNTSSISCTLVQGLPKNHIALLQFRDVSGSYPALVSPLRFQFNATTPLENFSCTKHLLVCNRVCTTSRDISPTLNFSIETNGTLAFSTLSLHYFRESSVRLC